MAYVIGLYGQLAAKASVYQHQQFHVFGAAKVQQSVHSRAYGAACVQHIVYQHHVPALYAELNIRFLRYVYALRHIIPVEGDIQPAVVNMFLLSDFLYQCGYPVAEEYPAGLNAYNGCIIKMKMVFYQLVRQPLQCNIQLIMIEQGLQILRCFGQK